MAITKNTKAIMPVHLTGRVCDMDPIMDIANRHNLIVIEDAAQAIGSKYKGKVSGSIGDIGCFSTHPLKNLNACGDGGFLTTNDEDIYNQLKIFRNHGMTDRNIVNNFGNVSRMDPARVSRDLVLCKCRNMYFFLFLQFPQEVQGQSHVFL